MKWNICFVSIIFAILFVLPSLMLAQQPPTVSAAAPVQILMIVTSTSVLEMDGKQHETGCWAEEMLEPASLFSEAGFIVTIASPKGGEIPFDTGSLNPGVVGADVAAKYKKLLENPEYRYALPLSKIVKDNDVSYDVVFLCGGHGTLADFPNNPEIKQILTRALEQRKIVAGVCHGVTGLLNLEGHPLMQGAQVGGFSDAEEQAIGLTPLACHYLGQSVQTRLAAMVGPQGGYSCGGLWEGYVVNYQNRLLTGQNPAASIPLAKEIIKVIQSLSRNPVKSSMQKNYPVFGSFVTIGHPSVPEVLCYSPIDFIWIEGEHAALTLSQIQALNISANQNKTVSIVRVPTNHPDTIKQYVDTGAGGIIVPTIKTAEDAAKVVRSLKYPPVGERGMGLGRSTGYFVHLKDYLAHANQDVLVILMIETKEAVANIDEIVQVPGIDLLSMGPFDLSGSLGLPGQVSHPTVQEAIAKVEAAAQKAGIPLGISVPNYPTAMKLMERGYRFFVIGADVEYLHQGVSKFFAPPTPPPVAPTPVPPKEPDLGWKIDDDIKYHYAYLEPDWLSGLEPTTPVVWKNPEPAPFSTVDKPDITNIELKGILGLGFPLPTRENVEKYSFYLKLYQYPEYLNANLSANRIIQAYLFDQMPGAEVLRKYMSNPKNVYIKQCVIAETKRAFGKEDPFPALKFPESPIAHKKVWPSNLQTFAEDTTNKVVGTFPAQTILDSSLPFVSLYLKPTAEMPANANDEALAQWSAQGMLSFHSQMLEVYRKNLVELDISDPDMYYFVQPSYALENRFVNITVWRIAKKPMIFSNFRNLPMPLDPARVFLSSLLLVYRDQYIGVNNLYAFQYAMSNPAFQQMYQPTESQVLEVGSVIILDK